MRKHQRPKTPQVQKFSWLDWNDGSLVQIQYKQNHVREKPVYLNINTHKPEPLVDILNKNVTNFDDFIRHGVVSFQRKK